LKIRPSIWAAKLQKSDGRFKPPRDRTMSNSIAIESQVDGNRQLSLSFKESAGRPRSLSKRIPELDGFRGIAVALAVFYHYIRVPIISGQPRFYEQFDVSTRLVRAGLEMFFILSGFLIGGILLDASSSPNYFKTFYIRRFCRIMPVYYAFLVLMTIAYAVVPWWPYPKPAFSFFWGNMPWYSYFTFTQNFWMAKWNTLGASIVSITWSLAVEEQFYLILPMIIRYVRRPALPYVFVSGIVLAPIIRLFLAYRFPGNLYSTYTLLPCRMDSLCLGALCAYLFRDPVKWNWLVTNRKTLWWMVLGLMAGMPLLNNKGVPFTPLWLLVGLGWMSFCFTLLMLLALTNPGGRLSRVMRLSWFTGLGEIGYGVYLFHLAVYCAVVVTLTGHGWTLNSWEDLGATSLAFLVTLGVAKLSWRYFEKPIVRWGHSWQY
jgi:peptidoglycan/LPS O-acetylase OafA/YrhL